MPLFLVSSCPRDLDRWNGYINDCGRAPCRSWHSRLRKNINGGRIPYQRRMQSADRPMPVCQCVLRLASLPSRIVRARAGKVLAEWVNGSETEWDMWSCNRARLHRFCDQDYSVARARGLRPMNMACIFPIPWPAGPQEELSPRCMTPNRRALSAHSAHYNSLGAGQT